MKVETLRILGIDDWLIFARDLTDGKLYYTNVELHPHWTYTPFGGHQEYGTWKWKRDWSDLLASAIFHPEEFDWTEADYPLNMSDTAFQMQTFTKLW